jgi:hypothetical protein
MFASISMTEIARIKQKNETTHRPGLVLDTLSRRPLWRPGCPVLAAGHAHQPADRGLYPGLCRTLPVRKHQNMAREAEVTQAITRIFHCKLQNVQKLGISYTKPYSNLNAGK